MDEKRELVAHLNGWLVPYSQAAADLTDGQAKSNVALYDAERTFGGQVFKLRQHLQRLYRSLDTAHLDPGLSLDKMEGFALQVLEANRHLLQAGEDFILGQVVSGGAKSGSNGQSGVSIVIYCQFIDFSAFAHSYVRGIRVVTPITYAVPSAQPESSADGSAQETYSLLTDDKGNVTECSHANFLFVKDGRIKLPNRENVLPGISMETVLELAESQRVPVDEDDYCALDVYPELPISSCLGPSNAPSSTRAIVVSVTDAVNHPIKLTKPSLGVVS